MTKDELIEELYKLYDEIVDTVENNQGYTNDIWEARKSAYLEAIELAEQLDP